VSSNSWIRVALTPAQADGDPADCAIVIDALRATTTIAALMDAGARSVTAVMDIDFARERARKTGAVLAGEVHGLAPDGFDLGNSPVEASEADIRSRDVVLFTTNGTRALCSARAAVIVAGSLTNLSAVVSLAAGHDRIAIVCAGNHGGTRFALEDFAVAGAYVSALLEGRERDINDEASVALRAVLGSEASVTSAAATLMRESDHASTTRALGLGQDVDFACQADISKALPVVVASGDGWVRLEDVQGARGAMTLRS
jgi:2-phosphosulfolactate phosphatase